MSMPEISREGDPALVTRMFGWITLGCLVAYMINNFLIVGWDYPGAMSALSGDTGGIVQLCIYLVFIVLAVLFVLRTPYCALRWDARRITAFNTYLIRGLFFTVLFVGLADVAISFMRVEKLLGNFVSDDIVRGMGRAQYVGTYVHMPLMALGFFIAYAIGMQHFSCSPRPIR